MSLVPLLLVLTLAPSPATPDILYAPSPAQTPAKPADLFPPAREAIEVKVDPERREPGGLVTLLDDFSRVTGVTVQMTRETQAVVKAVSLGLNRSITIPPSEVHRIVETLLIANDFVFIRTSNQEPRIWTVQSLQAGGGRGGPHVRNEAVIVDEKELGAWVDHPATLITTVIDLPHTDVRTLANSMRTMFTDANTQQVIPVGESSLILTGFPPAIAGIVRMLRLVDERSKSIAASRPAKVEQVKQD